MGPKRPDGYLQKVGIGMSAYGWCLDWMKCDETREESMLKIEEWLNAHRVNYSVIYYPGDISSFRTCRIHISTKNVIEMGLENAKELSRLHSTLKEWPLEYVDEQVERFFRENEAQMPVRSPTLKERFVEEFSDLVEGRDPRKMGIKAIFNTLLRGYPSKTISTTPEKFMKWLMSLTIGDLIDINEMGPIRIKTVLAIQERIQGTDGLQDRLLQNCDKIS